MTRIKLCGLSRPCDIEAANELKPEYVGFVFVPKSRRYVSPEKAGELKKMLDPDITAVGVFVNESAENIAALLESGTIDMAQLHGGETEEDIRNLRALSGKPVIKAFCINTAADMMAVQLSSADYVLLDSGAGTGTAFDWKLIQNIKRPYFLAGGLDGENVVSAVENLHPWAVDVSSGIETDGLKDKNKMKKFVDSVRKEMKP